MKSAGFAIVLLLAGAPGQVLQGQSLPVISGVFNGGSFDGRLAPGLLADVFGSNLGTDTSVAVTVGDKQATVLLALSRQLIIEIPVDAPVGPTTIRVANSSPFGVTLLPYAPGMLSQSGTGMGLVAAAHAQSSDVVDTFNPAVPGESLALYAVGLGPTNPVVPTGTPAPVSPPIPTVAQPDVTVGGQAAAIQFSGAAPAQIGLYQVIFTLAVGVPAGNQPIVLGIGGAVSQTLMLPVAGSSNPPTIGAVVNGASFAANAPLSPGSFASVFGSSFGSIDQVTGFPATGFAGVSVTFNGIGAPLIHLIASAGQIDLVVPSELPESGTVAVAVTTPAGTSASFTLSMAAAAPGIFAIPSSLNPKRRTAAMQFANTAWGVMPDALARELNLPGNCHAGGISTAAPCGEPAKPGDFIQIYMTGLGKATPNGDAAGTPLPTGTVAPADGKKVYLTVSQPAVAIGGVPAPVSFSGLAPGFAGLYQVNVQIPAGAPAGDDVPLTVTMPNGQADSSTTIAIRP
jgi:uncharacterized protein (TIGR03437 family)